MFNYEMFSLMLLNADPVAFDVTSIMSDAVSTVQAQVLSVFSIVVPAIVTVVSAVVVVRFGLKWLRQLGKA